MKKSKKTLRIGLAGRAVTFKGDYMLNYGTNASSYNKNQKNFKTRKAALKFRDGLIKKNKSKYKINYIYLAD